MDIRVKAYNEALYSALKSKGSVPTNRLLGIMLKEHPELKDDIAGLKDIIVEVCNQINNMSAEEVSKEAEEKGIVYEEKPRERKGLIELNINNGFRTRLPPEPSKHLHVGHAIGFMLSALYAEKYNGKIVLRIEDTNPQLARQEYVDSILDDINNYLGIGIDNTNYASDHMEYYYDNARQLISNGNAYACNCSREDMAMMRNNATECKCRNNTIEKNTIAFDEMIAGKHEPGTIVLRLKGDMQSKNMVMRDPVLFRIIKEPHYRHATKYNVWPVYDYENSLMDSYEEITHILRSNEFGDMRIELQNHIRELLNMRQPESIQYGRFSVEGATTKGREIRESISKGLYSGWDDPRLYTLKALRRKGITPMAIREIALEAGLSPTPTIIDKKMIATFNRRIIDYSSDRFSFVYDPIRIIVNGLVKNSELPLHPKDDDRGMRILRVNEKLFIRKEDHNNGYIRLADLANITIKDNEVLIDSYSIDDYRNNNGKNIINWLPDDNKQLMRCMVLMDDATIIEGLVEKNIMSKNVGDMVQLERFGFCRIESLHDDEARLIFAHK
ncbi:MAG: glutamate--tRNA ligase [Candidatus Woesearchaeota archaeon]